MGLAADLEAGEIAGMRPPSAPHDRHRFPTEVISRAVQLCHVVGLSLGDVALLPAEGGIDVSYDAVRCLPGQAALR